MNTFTTTIKNWLIDELEERKGQNMEVYPEDLAYILTDYINTNGSVNFSAWEASQFIKDNFYTFGDLIEYVKNNYDMDLNPMLEPEKAEVIAYIEGVNYLLNNLETLQKEIDKSEYDQIVLTDDLIDNMINELKNNDFEITF